MAIHPGRYFLETRWCSCRPLSHNVGRQVRTCRRGDFPANGRCGQHWRIRACTSLCEARVFQLMFDRAWRLSGTVPWPGACGAVRVIAAGAAPLSARCASPWSRWLPRGLELRPRTRRLRCKHCSSPLLRRVAEVLEHRCAVGVTPPHCLSQPAEKCRPQLKRRWLRRASSKTPDAEVRAAAGGTAGGTANNAVLPRGHGPSSSETPERKRQRTAGSCIAELKGLEGVTGCRPLDRGRLPAPQAAAPR